MWPLGHRGCNSQWARCRAGSWGCLSRTPGNRPPAPPPQAGCLSLLRWSSPLLPHAPVAWCPSSGHCVPARSGTGQGSPQLSRPEVGCLESPVASRGLPSQRLLLLWGCWGYGRIQGSGSPDHLRPVGARRHKFPGEAAVWVRGLSLNLTCLRGVGRQVCLSFPVVRRGACLYVCSAYGGPSGGGQGAPELGAGPSSATSATRGQQVPPRPPSRRAGRGLGEGPVKGGWTREPALTPTHEI